MIKYLFIGSLAFSISMAQPIYLECKMTNEDAKGQVYSIKIDESIDSVTFAKAFAKGNVEPKVLKAAYSPTTISFNNILMNNKDYRMVSYCKIDRKTLEFRNEIISNDYSQYPFQSKTIIENGKCDIIKTNNQI